MATNIEELFTLKEHNAGAEMQVRNKEGKLCDMFISVVGKDSKLWRNLEHELRVKTFKNEGDLQENRAEALACATLGWRGFNSKGKKLKFSKAKIKELYINAPYILEQVDLFLDDRSNFI